jgi:hypothetical protein
VRQKWFVIVFGVPGTYFTLAVGLKGVGEGRVGWEISKKAGVIREGRRLGLPILFVVEYCVKFS